MVVQALKEKSNYRRWAGGLVALALAGLIAPGRPARAQAPEIDKKVTVNLRDIPLRAAIDQLFAGTGMQYSVDPNVLNVPVNLTLRDVGLQAALRLLVRQASTLQPGLTFTKEGDIYQVRVRQAAPVAPVVEDLPPEFTDEKTEFIWEKIPIQFNNVAVFVMAFGGQMLPSEADVLMGNQNGGMNNGMNGMNGMNGGGGYNGNGMNGLNGMNGMNGMNGLSGLNGYNSGNSYNNGTGRRF